MGELKRPGRALLNFKDGRAVSRHRPPWNEGEPPPPGPAPGHCLPRITNTQGLIIQPLKLWSNRADARNSICMECRNTASHRPWPKNTPPSGINSGLAPKAIESSRHEDI
ncbi:unnamed protein product, partial [Iphiclides podalirius]